MTPSPSAQSGSMMPGQTAPATPSDVMRVLDDLGIPYRSYDHQAVFTVEEAEKVEHDIPGTHCRNLFLKDHKGRMFLVSLRNRTAVNLKKLQIALACGRLSFGSPERLYQYLGVTPGSVCAFAVMNDHAGAVTLVLEQEMMNDPVITFHPLINTGTVALSPGDLVRFARVFSHEPIILPCAGLGDSP
jgi:Ala-tRNA(Pro) deacylase